MALRVELISVTPFQQNCSLIWCDITKQAALIDPGGDIDRLSHAIKFHQLKLTKILLTHGHLDHAGGAKSIADSYLAGGRKVPIIGPHQEDIFWLNQLEAQSKRFGFPHTHSFLPDKWLVDSDIIKIGNETIHVLFCPGHTPGHVVFYSAESKLAFVGDVLFKGSIGRTDFPRGDKKTLIQSITRKLWPLGRDVRFVPGHGPMSTFGEERLSNPFVSDNVISTSEALF